MARWNRPNAAVREQYLEVERRMTALKVRLSDPPGTRYPADGLRRAVPDGGAAAIARLALLEAGAPVIVSGDQVGLAQDTRTYCLEGDGRLVPVEAVRDPDYPRVKAIRGWQRADGSLVDTAIAD
jgi:hypothetical protein